MKENKNLFYWIGLYVIGIVLIVMVVAYLVAITLGRYADKKEAALAYNNAAIIYFGDFACLNHIHT